MSLYDVLEDANDIYRRQGARRLFREAAKYLLRQSAYRWGDAAPPREMLTELRELLDSSDLIVVDAGAHVGNTTAQYLSALDPVHVHAIEPRPTAVDELRARFQGDDRVTIHPVALGPTNEQIEFHVTENEVSSSALQPTAANRDLGIDVGETITVQQVPLDGLLTGPVDLLKLDLQGYEREALTGAVDVLKDTRAVLCEVEFVPLYEDQATYEDISLFLREHGFHLYSFYDFHVDSRGRVVYADAAFVSDELSPRSPMTPVNLPQVR